MTIKRYDIHKNYASSSMVKANKTIYLSFNVGQSVAAQIEEAFDPMEERLTITDLSLDTVVKINVMFRDVWNMPLLEASKKCIETDFAHISGSDGIVGEI